MLHLRLVRSVLAALVVAIAVTVSAPGVAQAAQPRPALKSVCIEANTKFMAIRTRAQCRSARGRFLDLTKRPVTICVRTRAGVQRVSGAATGKTQCARGDAAQVLNGERARTLCASRTGVLRLPAAGNPCKRGEQRRIVSAGTADMTLTAASDTSSVVVGDSATITYTLRNAGPVAATNVHVRLQSTAQLALGATTTGTGTVTGTTWNLRRILPGSKVRLRVVVRGVNVGSASIRAAVGAMSQRDKTGAAATTKLAVVAPQLALSANAVAFDPLVQNNASAPRTLTVRNAGTSPTGAVSIARTGASVFTISADQCTGVVLAPGAACTVNLAFEPTDVGAAAATVTASAAGANSVSTNLSGTGLLSALSAIPLTPTEITAPLGAIATVQFVLTNNSETTTSTIGITTKGDGFAVGTSPCAGGVLAPHQSCVFGGTMTATSLGLSTGSITARAGLMNVTMPLSITGIPLATYTLTPDPVNFTPTAVGVAAPPELITITNTGTTSADNLTPSITGAFDFEFTISSNTCGGTLPPGASCVVTLESTASDPGARAVSFTMQAGNGNPTTIVVNSTGL